MGHADLAGTWHESSYRLLETYDVTVGPGWTIPLDPQPYAEVVLVRSGQLRVELGADLADARPGQLVVLLPGPPRLTAAQGAPVQLVGFGFRIELFGAIEMSSLLGVPVLVNHPSDSLVQLVMAAVAHGGGKSPAAALTARAYAELATAELVAAYGDVGSLRQVRTRPEIEAALAMMERDLSGPLDVSALARAVNMSPKHFARCFRDLVGVPPIAYLQAMRLNRARVALERTTQTTAVIAAAHGFADAAHFSRAFKSRYGVAPTPYRRQLRSAGSAAIGALAYNSVVLRDKHRMVRAADDEIPGKEPPDDDHPHP
ncbi:MAG TPA: AraC family transcriptional regulator [Streptosporangiaceae bacterium]|nr:AraC family transcriptional regulator [Streptosporangiaceae bacterium]